ncbi:MAG: diguanylate cyclase [Gammaproteobacteria bacterium SHHR-1]
MLVKVQSQCRKWTFTCNGIMETLLIGVKNSKPAEQAVNPALVLTKPLLIAVYLGLYLVLFASAALLDQGGFIASLWYPPAGLSVFGILAFGWAGVVLDGLANFLSPMLISPLQGKPPTLESLVSSAFLHPLAYGLVLMPLRKWLQQAEFIRQPGRTVGIFLIAALLTATAAAAVGIVRMLALGRAAPDSLVDIGRAWLMGDFIGILIFTPLFLLVLLPRLAPQLSTDLGIGTEAVSATPPGLTSMILLAVTPMLMLSLPSLFGYAEHSPFFALFLLMPLAWVALQWGLESAVTGSVMISSGLVVAAVLFGQQDNVIPYQLIMAAVALTGLLLGILVENRNRLQMQLRDRALRLEDRLSIKDQTLRKLYLESAITEQRLSALIEAAPVGIAQLDPEGHCNYLNPTGLKMARANLEDVLGRPFIDLVHCDHRKKLEQLILASKEEWDDGRVEFCFNNSDRWLVTDWISVTPSAHALVGSILIFVDITDRYDREQRLWNQANFDSLTEPPNRQFFMESLSQCLARAHRNGDVLAILWIDLDGFKAVNDTLGHSAGDILLQEVARRMKGRMRASDTLARMGGDEFAVILYDLAEREMANGVANDLVNLLSQPYLIGNTNCAISASIGISFYPDHARDGEALLRHADMAMYQAKIQGKGRALEWSGEEAIPTVEHTRVQ